MLATSSTCSGRLRRHLSVSPEVPNSSEFSYDDESKADTRFGLSASLRPYTPSGGPSLSTDASRRGIRRSLLQSGTQRPGCSPGASAASLPAACRACPPALIDTGSRRRLRGGSRGLITRDTGRIPGMPKSATTECLHACIALLRDCSDRAAACCGGRSDVECIRVCREYADLCALCASFMARDHILLGDLCEQCARACESCAAECDGRQHEQCHRCAEQFRECAAAWRRCAETGRSG